MSKGEIRARLVFDSSDFNRGIERAQEGVNRFQRSATSQLDGLGGTMEKLGTKMTLAGAAMVAAGHSIKQIFSPLAGVLTKSLNVAIDYESAFTGVRKTVDATEPEFQQLSNAIVDMSKKMPQSASEIAKVMEIAGQLGIRGVDNLEKFTQTAIMLGDSTNLSSDQASTSLARFLNITGSGVDTVDRLGAALVHLGNNTATTEAEIMNMGLRLASAGRQIGLTDSDILGFSATLTALGIRAEMGGSAFSKLMINMEVACQRGGDSLDDFSRIAGLSADEFKEKFANDAKGAILAFLQGLNNIEKSGGSVINTLDEMGIKEIRLRDTVLRAAAGVDQMSHNLEIGNQAYKDNTALVEEAQKRYKTFASRLEIFKNKIAAIGIKIGTAMMPYMEKLLSAGEKLIQWVDKINPKILGFVGAIGVVGTALGSLVMVLGTLGLAVGGTMIGLSTMASMFTAIGTAIAAVTAPVWAIVAAIGSLVAAITWCWNNLEGFRSTVIESFNKIKTVVSEAVMAVASIIKTVWGGLEPFVTTIFKGVSTVIGKYLGTTLKVVSTIVSETWEIIKTIWGLIEPFVSKSCSKAYKSVKDDFDSMYKTISTVVKAAWTVIDTTWGLIEPFISSLAEGTKAIFEGDFSSAWNILVEAAKKSWENLKSVGEKIINTTKNIANKCVEKFNSFKENLPQKIEDGMANASKSLSGWGSNLRDKAATACKNLVEGFKGLREGMDTKLNESKERSIANLETWKEVLPKAIEGLSKQLVEKAHKWTEELPNKLEETKQNMLTKIETWKEVMPKAIEDVKNRLIENLNRWTEELPMKIEVMMNKFVDIITGKKDDTSDAMETVGDSLEEKVDEVEKSLPSLMFQCMLDIGKAIKDNAPDIARAMGQLALTLIKIMVFDLIPALVRAAWDAMISVGKTFIDSIPEVTAKLSEVWNKCKEKTREGWENIKRAMSDKWSDMKSAMARPFLEAWDEIRSIPSKIANAFSNLHISIPRPKIPHIDVGSKEFFGGAVSVPTFSLNWYATGGYFDDASVVGVGEAGKEAVLPLENKKNMKPFAQAVANLMDNFSGGSSSGEIVNNINISSLVVREEADIQRIAEELQTLQRRENRRRGIS